MKSVEVGSSAMHIAMWSGPRNISTALMRAWENRNDTTVWDEPFYAYYLRVTGVDHPGADEVIANGEPDWREVVDKVTGPIPDDRAIFYQKHMTHHLLPEIDRGWLAHMTNCFLIRDPREVIASYAKVRTNLTVADVGIPQQADIFEWVRSRTGRTPLVLDARDVLKDPHRMMAGLCAALDVPFTEHMLAWPPGARDSDGVWGKYWYASVWASTGFAPYEPTVHTLPKHLEPLAEACAPHYRTLYQCRLDL